MVSYLAKCTDHLNTHEEYILLILALGLIKRLKITLNTICSHHAPCKCRCGDCTFTKILNTFHKPIWNCTMCTSVQDLVSTLMYHWLVVNTGPYVKRSLSFGLPGTAATAHGAPRGLVPDLTQSSSVFSHLGQEEENLSYTVSTKKFTLKEVLGSSSWDLTLFSNKSLILLNSIMSLGLHSSQNLSNSTKR